MNLLELCICLLILVCLMGLCYPSLKRCKDRIEDSIALSDILRDIRENRQMSIDNGGEPVTMGKVTYWPTRCTPHVFTTKRLKIQLSDYYFIEVKPNETTR